MPRRRPLGDIPVNCAPCTELSNDTKQRLLGRALAGQSGDEIATAESLPKSTVNTSLQNAITRGTTANKPRSGQPKKYTDQDERRVLRYARYHPKWTYSDLTKHTGLDLHPHTFRAILQKHGIINWRCKRRPYITASHARQRLAWARQNRNTDWLRVLFSDECSVERGAGKKQAWAFGYPSEKWDYNKLQTYNKGKGVTVMVWAAIGDSVERSELVVMERDETSPRGGYSATSYVATLEQGLLPIYDGQTYMHDNAPVHTARSTTSWLANWGIYVLPNWPPYSPDLNPIEHLWYHLKQMLYELLPHLDDIEGIEQQRQAIVNTLPEAWRRIRSDIVKVVLDSMLRRIQAVIDAQGWQTKY